MYSTRRPHQRRHRRVEHAEGETQVSNQHHAKRKLDYYHDDEGYLVIKAKLPAEQGAIVVKAIEAARDILWKEHKNVSAETPSGFKAESSVEPRADEPYGAERADALCLMAETFQAGEMTTRNGAERCQVVIHVDEQVLKAPQSPGRCECEAGPALAAQTARPGAGLAVTYSGNPAIRSPSRIMSRVSGLRIGQSTRSLDTVMAGDNSRSLATAERASSIRPV